MILDENLFTVFCYYYIPYFIIMIYTLNELLLSKKNLYILDWSLRVQMLSALYIISRGPKERKYLYLLYMILYYDRSLIDHL